MRFARRALAGAAVLLAYGAAPLSPVPQAAWPAYQYRGDHNAVFAAPPGGAVWKRTFGGKINGALSIVGSTLYVESMGEDRKLYALDLGSGAIRWSAALPNIAMNAPVVAGGIVFAGTGSNHIMVDAGASALIGIPGGDYVIAFDAKSGAPLWRYNTPGEDMPTGAAGVVGETPAFLFAGGDGHLRALSAADGKLLWQNRFPGIAPMSSLALAGNLVVGSSETTPSFTLAAHEAENQADLENDTWTWAARISDGQFVWVAPHG
ncbi:MAG TPA: PQQ-binding-like beta-propeller repeat protein, partial [Verrucomicrobiae bacterium]|nr:PQQ-binding-like beta-propeller repeat protein [Verrucomicrobiae bacterium]